MALLDFLFPPRSDEAVVRGVSRDAFLALLAPVPVRAAHPEAIALLPFADVRVRAAIHEAKYHGSAAAFALLAEALAEYLRDADLFDPSAAVLVPVPLGRARRRERGYNQVEEVARRAAEILGIPVDAELLARTRETASQVALERGAREENVRGAFACGARMPGAAHTYILLDDVLTTGATIRAAAGALAEAGAAYVTPVALAH